MDEQDENIKEMDKGTEETEEDNQKDSIERDNVGENWDDKNELRYIFREVKHHKTCRSDGFYRIEKKKDF